MSESTSFFRALVILDGVLMPEGPEVKRVVDQLSAKLNGSKLLGMEILSGRYSKKSPDNFDYIKNLFPLELEQVKCKGKFIYFTFKGSQVSIWNTLGMTGGWRAKRDPYSRLKLQFDNGEVLFSDVRNFGTLHIVKTKEELKKKLNTLGHDILDSPMESSDFRNLLLSKRFKDKTLPEFLMSQNGLCGVGNYIKSESLYMSKLSPHRLCSSLSDSESSTLLDSIRNIITTSYKSGGSTIQAYADFHGQSGTYSSRFAVYQRKVDPIGNEINRITTADGRTTHWVPAVQK